MTEQPRTRPLRQSAARRPLGITTPVWILVAGALLLVLALGAAASGATASTPAPLAPAEVPGHVLDVTKQLKTNAQRVDPVDPNGGLIAPPDQPNFGSKP